MRLTVFLLVLFGLFGCDKDSETPQVGCDLTFPFIDGEWQATQVQPSECRWMLFKHEYLGMYFYSVGNHCVDMAAFVAACDGVNICDTDTNLCENILYNGTSLGIVAVEK